MKLFIAVLLLLIGLICLAAAANTKAKYVEGATERWDIGTQAVNAAIQVDTDREIIEGLKLDAQIAKLDHKHFDESQLARASATWAADFSAMETAKQRQEEILPENTTREYAAIAGAMICFVGCFFILRRRSRTVS